MPSHVFKRGNGASGCPPGGDCMSLGKWVDGAPGEVGSWAAVDGVPHEEKLIYAGDFYASKDFEDTPNQRRINWGSGPRLRQAQGMALALSRWLASSRTTRFSSRSSTLPRAPSTKSCARPRRSRTAQGDVARAVQAPRTRRYPRGQGQRLRHATSSSSFPGRRSRATSAWS